MMVTTDKPKREIERTFDLRGMVFISFIIGNVTNFSISSALLPGHCVMILALVLVTSGKASIGVFCSLTIPVTTSNPVRKNTINEFFKEKATICCTIFCMINLLFLTLIAYFFENQQL